MRITQLDLHEWFIIITYTCLLHLWIHVYACQCIVYLCIHQCTISMHTPMYYIYAYTYVPYLYNVDFCTASLSHSPTGQLLICLTQLVYIQYLLLLCQKYQNVLNFEVVKGTECYYTNWSTSSVTPNICKNKHLAILLKRIKLILQRNSSTWYV